MSKITLKPSVFLNPVPVIMVTSGTMEESNIMTVAWTGTICTDPPMVYISVRKERYSYNLISKNKEFVLNLVSEDLAKITDWCGVKSGKEIDKFKEMKITKEEAKIVKAPLIKESPVNIECEVIEIKELGSHDMFIAKVVNINVDEKYIDENGKIDLEACNLVAYSHGQYYKLGKNLGHFGYSVRKKK